METVSVFPLPGADVALRVAVEEEKFEFTYRKSAYLRFFLLPADPRREEVPVHPDPEDREWALEALAALRVGWAEPKERPLQALGEELALRRAVARRFGRELAGMVLRAIPDTEYRGQEEGSVPLFRVRPSRKVPLLWMGALLAWKTPGARGDYGGYPKNVLQGSIPLESFISLQDGVLHIPGACLPGEFRETARALELEIQEEIPDPRALAEKIRETAARAAYLFHRAPHETALARWEELEALINRLQELEASARRFLETTLGRWPADPADVRELQEALGELQRLLRGDGRRPGLPRTFEERAARRRERILALAERRKALARDGIVAEVGLVRAWIRPDGEVRPLDELPDDYPGLADLLEEEAGRLEALAGRYRRRADAMERRSARRALASPEPEIPAEPGRPRYLYAGRAE